MDTKFMIVSINQPIKIHVVDQVFSSYSKASYMLKWINNGNTESTDLANADIIILRGGEDISPKFYKEEPNNTVTWLNNQRDTYEQNIFNYALSENKFIVGICRGAQLITALNGGRLIQHVNHHFGNHKVFCTIDKKERITSSVHHQMCWPYDLPKDDYEILAFSKSSYFKERKREIIYLGQDDKPFYPTNSEVRASLLDIAEPELIYYPKTRCLGIQGHPENGGDDQKDYVDYINKILLTKLVETK